MKKIGFIGAFEKTSLILYIAKILTLMGEKVLVVDTTIEQRARYIVPTITSSPKYITNFEDIDVSVGLYTFEDIANALNKPSFDQSEYTYILLDIDNAKVINLLNVYEAQKNYFVTGFDLYSLKKGIKVLDEIEQPLDLTKVLFSKNMMQEEDDYLNYLSLGKKVNWSNEKIYFPMENGDYTIIAENQRFEKIKLKGISSEYKDALTYILEQITEGNNVRKLIKQFEREG